MKKIDKEEIRRDYMKEVVSQLQGYLDTGKMPVYSIDPLTNTLEVPYFVPRKDIPLQGSLNKPDSAIVRINSNMVVPYGPSDSAIKEFTITEDDFIRI